MPGVKHRRHDDRKHRRHDPDPDGAREPDEEARPQPLIAQGHVAAGDEHGEPEPQVRQAAWMLDRMLSTRPNPDAPITIPPISSPITTGIRQRVGSASSGPRSATTPIRISVEKDT